MVERFESFMLLMARINKYVRKIRSVEMEKMNLKSGHALCIYYLYKNKRLTMTALSRKCGEDKASLSRAIDFLKTEGYIESGDSSGYKNPLRLTEKGILAGKELSEKIDDILSVTSIDVDKEDRDVMYITLEKIADNLSKIYNSYEEHDGSEGTEATG